MEFCCISLPPADSRREEGRKTSMRSLTVHQFADGRGFGQGRVTIESDTSLGRGARAGLDGVNMQLRAREEDKHNHSVVQTLLNA